LPWGLTIPSFISLVQNMYVQQPLTVGAGGGAPVGVVTELMDVHATLSIGVVASDIPCNGSGG
jgi:hypothetical protein